ncbi:hypothetical protein Scep_014095 [Stephania cephalantha]|uniref:Uncharacterized protein n=1 Tax=Stephania cephalantha TaxID=152367 RepID=A0AAP0J0M5_9MAGN
MPRDTYAQLIPTKQINRRLNGMFDHNTQKSMQKIREIQRKKKDFSWNSTL